MGDTMTDSTGSSSNLQLRQPHHWEIVSGHSSGEHYTTAIETSGSRATGSSYRSAGRVRRPAVKRTRVSPLARQTCNTMLSAITDDLQRAVDNKDDVVLKSNAIEHSKERLVRLWSIRSQRETQFAELINTLQLSFAELDSETLSDDTLSCFLYLFERLRDNPTYDDAFVNEMLTELLRNNIDVFRSID